MPFTFKDLQNRRLEIIIPIEKEEKKGEFSLHDFRVWFRDLSAQNHSKLIEESDAEAEKLLKEYEAQLKVYEDAKDKSKLKPPQPSPSGQQIYNFRSVDELPDLVNEKGKTFPLTQETFIVIGQSMNSLIYSGMIRKRLGL